MKKALLYQICTHIHPTLFTMFCHLIQEARIKTLIIWFKGFTPISSNASIYPQGFETENWKTSTSRRIWYGTMAVWHCVAGSNMTLKNSFRISITSRQLKVIKYTKYMHKKEDKLPPTIKIHKHTHTHVLCGVGMLSLCLRGSSHGTPVSSHPQKYATVYLNASVNGCLSSLCWVGDLSTVYPDILLFTAEIGSSTTTIRWMTEWMNAW